MKRALTFCLGVTAMAAMAVEPPADHAEVLTREHLVDAARPEQAWLAAAVGQALFERDRLRTGSLSRASLRLTDLAILRVNELTTLMILKPEAASSKPSLNLEAGAVYFFSREKPQEMHLRTPVVTGALRGTEFNATVGAGGRTVITMFEGELDLQNAQGRLVIRTGEQATVEPGRAPVKTAVIDAVNIIQWCLYYPGIIDLADLHLGPAERAALGPSLAAYESGDLLQALARYPWPRSPGSAGERTYRAALVLSVGQVEKAEALLAAVPRGAPGATALRQLVEAVKFREYTRAAPPATASDWMAESYYRQSRSDLAAALEAARRAAAISPNFGFATARVAELEFSFGRIRPAREALDRSLKLAPRNAQAVALGGFLRSAENRMGAAREAFEEAIALDPALGNAWLGRGLTRIRKGDAEGGRLDLQIAAALEPNRSLLRSYLGKAFANTGSDAKTNRELARAKELDPRDPTPFLYSALQNKQENRINDAVHDLETSLALNDNRRVYRSGFLLDQDRAVRGANLAAIYRADGMLDYSVREADRAVESDYASASAHLFLASSYDALRDPRRVILRYETPWFNELLLANMLSPVGGGPLSQFISQQEYSKLFEGDRLGGVSTTQYDGRGQLRETASQFGLAGNLSYAIDSDYFHDSGARVNNRVERLETYAQFKLQLGLQDTLFFQTKFEDFHTGDVFQYYDESSALPTFDFHERQDPALLLAGYHHEWAPGVHTLLLGGRLAGRQAVRADETFQSVLVHDDLGRITSAGDALLDFDYRSQFVAYTGELNQIWQTEKHTFVLGARIQRGEFETAARLDHVEPALATVFHEPASDQDFTTDFARTSVYAYHFWRVFEPLTLLAGLGYDRVTYPRNFRRPPLLDGSKTVEKLLPKIGAVWHPFTGMTVRGGYTESISGASFDESIRLEPTQFAGFNQSYRTVISESLAGSVAAPVIKALSLGLDQKLSTRTYFGLELARIRSSVDDTQGVFRLAAMPDAIAQPSATRDDLHSEESVLTASFNQLVGRDWAFGANYQVSRAELHQRFPEVPAAITPAADQLSKATLQQLQLFTLFNHPSGFFARAEAIWYNQESRGAVASLAGDDFWQYNFEVGRRFAHNRLEIAVGALNLGGENYHLYPLNLYAELPRERTFITRLRMEF